MGTRLGIVVEGVGDAEAHRLAEAALREIERADALLSTWSPEASLGRLNRAPVGQRTDVPPELRSLLREVDAWSVRTARAFDARIGALVDAWHLRGPGPVPDAVALEQARRASGPGSVELDDTGLVRRSEAAWIDSGGFGKGAALRWASAALAGSIGEAAVLLDLGGQILALGPAEAPWTVGVAHPDRRSERVAALELQGRSAATTGNSERGRHVLDPRTGRPVRAWGSVTVVDGDPLAADVLSTSLYVMGPQDGLAWARRAGVAALFLESIGGGVRATWTPGLEPWLIHAPDSPRHLNYPSERNKP